MAQKLLPNMITASKAITFPNESNSKEVFDAFSLVNMEAIGLVSDSIILDAAEAQMLHKPANLETYQMMQASKTASYLLIKELKFDPKLLSLWLNNLALPLLGKNNL